jgi:hypothetical protein
VVSSMGSACLKTITKKKKKKKRQETSGHHLLGDKGVNLAKVLEDVLHEVLALLVLADIALVGLDLGAVLLGQLLDVLLGALLAGGICDGDVGAHLGTSPSSLDTHALRAGGAGDDDDLALEGEEVLEAGGGGGLLRHFGWRGGVE